VELPNDEAPDELANQLPATDTLELDWADYIYSFDGPGVGLNTPQPGDMASQYLSAREWVRVRFVSQINGLEPAVFDGERVLGSRASNEFEWHARSTITVNSNGQVVRTTGDEHESNQNDVAPGAISEFGPPDFQ
jgi:hypothetical protein